MRRIVVRQRRGFSLVWCLTLITANAVALALAIGLYTRMLQVHRALRIGGETARAWQDASSQLQADAWDASACAEHEGGVWLTVGETSVEYRLTEHGLTRREMAAGKQLAAEVYRLEGDRQFRLSMSDDGRQVHLQLQRIGPDGTARTALVATAQVSRHLALRGTTARAEP